MTVFLENCEGFNFTEGEPAYCSGCGYGVAYVVGEIPDICKNCNNTIISNIKSNPKGLHIISDNHTIGNT